MSSAPPSSFSVQHARDLVKDLFLHKAWIYWSDFLLTITVGYSAAFVYLNYPGPIWSWQRLTCYVIAGFALFRAGSWIHEIVHFRGRQLQRFTIAWNILAGIPMLMPSFFYSNHIDHHSTKHYGTGQDGEYLPLGSGPLAELAYFWMQVFVLPVAIFWRFLAITPLSLIYPPLRQWALERFSFFVINLRYRHDIPRGAPLFWWGLLEFCCFLRAAALVGWVLAGWAPPERIALIYSIAVLTLGLNYVRNMVAHHYRSNGEPMGHVEQLFDSINLRGMPVVTELFFPLGLRYHALHHLFPSLPYHNLPAAHRRLMAELPAESRYRDIEYPGFWSVVREVVRNARRVSRAKKANGTSVADEWYERRKRLLGERYGGRRDDYDEAAMPDETEPPTGVRAMHHARAATAS